MAVSWTAFQPGVLKACWTTNNGVDLKPSCTTRSYSGGNPSAATDLKSSIVDYDTGNLREGLVTPTALKASLLQ